MPKTWTRIVICIGFVLTLMGSLSASTLSQRLITKPHCAITTENRIAAMIYSEQPKKGKGYAHVLAHYICVSAKRNNLDPYVLAAVAWQESTFSMSSRPAIGIMQILPSTARSQFKKSGLKPHVVADNVEMGARYLRICQGNMTSRGGYDRMLGRYNGCGPRGGYVRSVLRRANKLSSLKIK